MMDKLLIHADKPGWDKDTSQELIQGLADELDELASAIKFSEGTPDNEIAAECVISEAADVANYAMMIAGNARRRLKKMVQESAIGQAKEGAR